MATALPVVAATYVLAFVGCVAARFTFAFELSWLESGMQAMTDRLVTHQSIYVEPSPAYVPFIYPPLYYVVAHALDLALPALQRFMSMRLVSLLATLATAATVFLTLRQRSSLSSRHRLLLTALFVAFFGRFEFWYDTSRVDSLFVALLFAATALLFEGDGAPSALAAGCLGGLAVLTKQPAAPLFAGALVMCALRRPRRALFATTAGVLSLAGGLAVIGDLGNPWLYYYVLRVPTTHPLLPRTLGTSLIFALAVFPSFVLAAAFQLRRPPVNPRSPAGVWPATFAIWIVMVFLLRLKQGASFNFFLPLVPVGLIVLANVLENWAGRGELFLLVQFLILAYNPLAAIPTAPDWRAGYELLDELDHIPGPIFLPQFPSYLTMLGRPPVAHGIAVCDLAKLRPDLMRTIRAQMLDGHFTAAVPWRSEDSADRDGKGCRPSDLPGPFRFVENIPSGGDFFAVGHGSKLGGIYRLNTGSWRSPQ